MSVNEGGLVVRVAGRGDGVTADGRHVPLAAPGDIVSDAGAIQPGPHHTAPICRHFPECGGCQLQHLDDVAWAGFIEQRIANALTAHGLRTEIRQPLLSPPMTRRRATLHAERVGKQVAIGFTAQGSHKLIDLHECHVLSPEITALVGPLRALLRKYIKPGRRHDIHIASADQGCDVLIHGIVPEGLAALEELSGFAQQHALARLSIDDGFGPATQWMPEPVTVNLGGVPVSFPPGNFLQATPEGEHALISAVREIVGDAKMIADLFAGLGTFSFAFPSAKVYAAEGARDPILALKAAAGQAGRMVFADHRDLFRRPLSAADAAKFEAVIIDPPRAGAKEQAAELAKSDLRTLAYVSCNPSTFARDAEILCEGGFVLDWIQPVGQFRWSTHVELAAQFTRK